MPAAVADSFAPRQAVLVVDDDPKIVATLSRYLSHAGFAPLTAADGLAALAVAREQRPSLIVLDRMLPELDGTSVCRILRRESSVPIIMLTARAAESERLEGLELGADDYVVKPFSPRELVARVRAVLRRSAPTPNGAERESPLTVGELTLDRAQHEAWVRGERVELTATEFRLLTVLASAPGRVYTRGELMEQLFGWDHSGSERGVDVHVKNVRRKIERDRDRPAILETVFGVGYRLAKPRA